MSGAAAVEDVPGLLTAAGFTNVEITPKANSREIVAAWMPGTGVEDFVAAAIVCAEKPDGALRGFARALTCQRRGKRAPAPPPPPEPEPAS